ncbi:MAG: hypothetical protein ABJA70_15555 [Chryseolinea sp.]
MKKGSGLLSIVYLLSLSLFFVGCGGDDPTTSEEETQLNKLKSTWTLQSVNNDGNDRTSEYPGMTLTISGTFTSGGTYNYSSTATDWPSVSPWKAIDTWKFKSDAVSSSVVRLIDLIEMNYLLTNSDNTLSLTFDYPDTGTGFNNGRTETVKGKWTFTFSK